MTTIDRKFIKKNNLGVIQSEIQSFMLKREVRIGELMLGYVFFLAVCANAFV